MTSFILRIPSVTHASLKSMALANGVSLNKLCQKLLDRGIREQFTINISSDGQFAPIVERARMLLGTDLLGVVVFGSYVRAQATESSDIDILVVIDPRRKLDRSLYTLWSNDPSQIERMNNLPLSVHFANLPGKALGCSGLWLEIALDGIVVWDPTWAVNRFLNLTRRYIVEGIVSHKVSHGQRYWIWNKEAA